MSDKKSKKMKVRKSISNRFKVTATGKLIYASNFNSHLKSSKSKSRIRRLKQPKVLKGKLAGKIKKLI